MGKFLTVAVAALGILTGATQCRAAEQISVTHWGVLMYGAPYAVAMEKGLFKQAGIDIDGFLSSKGGGTTVRNVLAGGLPFGEVSLAAAVAASNQGIDIRIVNTGAATVGEILWVTLPDSPIKTMQDLVGKKVGFTSAKSVTDMVLIMALEKSGIKPTTVDRVSIGGIGAGLTALQQGGVVAAPIMDPVWAQYADKYKPIFFAKDLLPTMTQTVGITTPDFIKSSPDKLKAIIAGRRAGVDYTYAHPEEAGAIFAKAYNLEPKLAERAIHNMVDIKFWSAGAIDRKALDAMVEGLRIIGDVEGPVDWNKLVDNRFLPADQQAAGS